MKIVFMGTPDFAATILQKLIDEQYDVALVVSQPDRPVGRKKELLPTPAKKIAQKYQIETFQPEKIKMDYQMIQDVLPDLIITAAYGQLIPKALIDLPRLGCINVHASLLPKYRGGAPIHQAIIDGESETGITIQYMEVAMDTGDMIAQESLPISPFDDVGTLFYKLGISGADLLIKTLPAIQNGTNDRIPQNHEAATYASNIKREDEWIDWSKTAQEIHNQIRGLNPWPTAYTSINGINIKVFKSEMNTDQHMDLPPGKLLTVNDEHLAVTCGNQTILYLTEVQLAGKKRMSLRDLLNGDSPLQVGEMLGR